MYYIRDFLFPVLVSSRVVPLFLALSVEMKNETLCQGGEDCILVCNVIADSPFTELKFRKNSKEEPSIFKNIYVHDGNFNQEVGALKRGYELSGQNLTIPKCSKADEANYMCYAFDGKFSDSKITQVKVTYCVPEKLEVKKEDGTTIYDGQVIITGSLEATITHSGESCNWTLREKHTEKIIETSEHAGKSIEISSAGITEYEILIIDTDNNQTTAAFVFTLKGPTKVVGYKKNKPWLIVITVIAVIVIIALAVIVGYVKVRKRARETEAQKDDEEGVGMVEKT